MHRLRRFVFLLGGVLIPRLNCVIQRMGAGDALDSVRLHQLIHQLTLGQLSLNTFCKELAIMSPDTDINWENDLVLWMTHNEAMQPILDTLAGKFELVLLSDYPVTWCNNILDGSPFAGYCSQIVHTAHEGPHDTYVSLFEYLIENEVMKPGRTVMVDWHSQQPSAAINTGLDAAIFIDAARFYRDLGLWGIVPLLDINTIRTNGWA